MTLPFISAAELAERVGVLDAIRAIQGALREGFDPALDTPRGSVPLEHGEFLIMPSGGAEFAGVKVLTVAPGNPARGLERIQGVYVLFDAVTLAPVALLEGAALTGLRTPAVSAAAADILAPPRVEHLVVFGSGPQALGHVAALRAVRDVGRVTIVGRDAVRAEAAAAVAGASVGGPSAVSDADVIVCATTAREPVFDSRLVRDDVCVIAVGSHEPDAREVDAHVLSRALVAVEDRVTALREAGDVVLAIGEGALDPDALVSLRELVRGEVEVDRSRPRLFKSVGMSWQDLVIAAEAHRRAGASGTDGDRW